MSPSRSLDELTKGDTLGIRVTDGGKLEIFINGESEGYAVQNVPLHNDIWAVVDMYGTCQQISVTDVEENINSQTGIEDTVQFAHLLEPMLEDR